MKRSSMIRSTMSLPPVLMLIVLLRCDSFFRVVVMLRINYTILSVLLSCDWQLDLNCL